MRLAILPSPLPRAARAILVAGLAFAVVPLLAACSSTRTQDQSWAGAQPPVPAPTRQAAYEAAPGDPIKDPPVEPLRRPGGPADDPTEPYSPNYGGARTRPPVTVSDTLTEARDPEPDQQQRQPQRTIDPSRAYFRKSTATAAAD